MGNRTIGSAGETSVLIRPARPEDREALLQVERDAFGSEVEAGLVADLLDDATAQPLTSLVADENGAIVGHVLFTALALEEEGAVTASLLAPLAVRPDRQKRGIGSALVRDGLELLRAAGCDWALTLGDPAYYGRFGFTPARERHIRPPFELVEDYRDAWMALRVSRRALPAGDLVARPALAIAKPEYWAP